MHGDDLGVLSQRAQRGGKEVVAGGKDRPVDEVFLFV
jgi:hypothetical protein